LAAAGSISARPALRVVTQETRAAVAVSLTRSGTRRLAAWTTSHQGHPLAIFVDDRLVAAPIIREPLLGESRVIAGRFKPEQARDLARKIDPH
jgi:preprotein translocase subunit SecD